MSKKKEFQRQQLMLSSLKRQRIVVTGSLLLTLALAGGLLTRWKAMSVTTAIPVATGLPTVGVNAVLVPQASPSPPSLAKEYIYAGDRLMATVELLEADVNPQPEGSGTLTAADWVKVGRLTAGLDTPASPSEFQRADCASKSTRGNGILSVGDWVQAGRYVAGLDPPQYQGGPIASSGIVAADGPIFAMAAPSASLTQLLARAFRTDLPLSGATARVVRIVSPTFVGGQNGTVIIEMDSLGDENAVGLSLSFNTAQLTFVSAVRGSDASAGSLNVNSNSAASGRVGLLLSLPSGQSFAAGTRQLVVVTFSASSSGSHVVSSADEPVWREVADVNANTLVATFTP